MHDCFQTDEYFQIDDIDSRTVGKTGIRIVRLPSDKDEMIIFGGQSVIWNKPQIQDYYSFINTDKENIKFTLLFSLIDDEFTPQMNYTLGRIFAKTKPVEFIYGEDKSKMLYVVPTSNFTIDRIEGYKGTVPITFEATTPYWLSNPMSVTNVTLGANDTFTMQNICNVPNQQGNYNVYPYIKITIANTWKILEEDGGYVRTELNGYALTEKSMNIQTEEYQQATSAAINSDGSINFKLINITNDECVLQLNGVRPGEIIEMKDIYEIKSSLNLIRFGIWNKEPFYLIEGHNEFKVNFPCLIEVKLRYPIVK